MPGYALRLHYNHPSTDMTCGNLGVVVNLSKKMLLKIKKIIRSYSVIIIAMGLAVMVFSPIVFLWPKIANAQSGYTMNWEGEDWTAVGTGELEGYTVDMNEVQVYDEANIKAKLKEKKERDWVRKLKTAGAAAFKQALKYFVNTLAYDTATWVASGGKGQDAMFEKLGWSEYMRRLGDNAAGHFIQGFSSSMGNFGKTVGLDDSPWLNNIFMGMSNLCNPQFNVNLRITLGLRQTQRPREPNCTWSQIQDNWTNFIENPDFLNRFKPVFDPNQNQLGVTLGVYSNFFRAVAGKPDVLAEDRKEGEGIKPVKDTVSEYIKTPSKLVFEGINKFLVDLPAEPEKTFTGEIVAD